MTTYTEDLADSDEVEIDSSGNIVPIGSSYRIPSDDQLQAMTLPELRAYASKLMTVSKYWGRAYTLSRITTRLSGVNRLGVRPPKHTFYGDYAHRHFQPIVAEAYSGPILHSII